MLKQWGRAALCPSGSAWRQWLHVFAAGLVTALTLPPYHFLPAFLAIIPFFEALRGASMRRAFALGFGWYFGFHLLGLYWIVYALLTDAEAFGWLVPFAITLIPAALGLLCGTAMLLYVRVARYAPIVLFVACFTLMDMGREFIFFNGFPWNPLATGLSWHPALMQWAAWVGIYGVGALLMLIVLGLSAWLLEKQYKFGIAALALAVLMVGSGAWRASQPVTLTDITIRIVQPNISQHHKWNEAHRRDSLMQTMQLAASPAAEPLDAVVLPETGIPYSVRQGRLPYESAIAGAVPEGGVLFSGVVREHGTYGEADFALYNSVVQLNDAGRIEQYYDKRELVPFGEYIPLRQWLPLTKITYGAIDFSSGASQPPLSAAKLPPVSVQICYESIYSQGLQVDDAEWIINVTNDAWFGDSPGPHQHLAAAQWRAVESGLPLVRAANTGISALIDPYGRVMRELALNQASILDVQLPLPIKKYP